MDKTHGKYTVRVYCSFRDDMVDEEVLAENDHDSFRLAEEQHDDDCSVVYPCSSEGWSFSEGWISEGIIECGQGWLDMPCKHQQSLQDCTECVCIHGHARDCGEYTKSLDREVSK